MEKNHFSSWQRQRRRERKRGRGKGREKRGREGGGEGGGGEKEQEEEEKEAGEEEKEEEEGHDRQDNWPDLDSGLIPDKGKSVQAYESGVQNFVWVFLQEF